MFTQSYDTSESVAGDEGEAGADVSTWAGEADFVTRLKRCVSHILIASWSVFGLPKHQHWLFLGSSFLRILDPWVITCIEACSFYQAG